MCCYSSRFLQVSGGAPGHHSHRHHKADVPWYIECRGNLQHIAISCVDIDDKHDPAVEAVAQFGVVLKMIGVASEMHRCKNRVRRSLVGADDLGRHY